MKKINKIIIGTRNDGKFKEICDLLPKNITKISPRDLNLLSPDETGNTFEENSKIKAEYFTKKTNQIQSKIKAIIKVKKIRILLLKKTRLKMKKIKKQKV